MWYYKNDKVESIEDMPEGVFGFVYQIVHMVSGKKYIGKKQLMSNRTLPPLKGQKKKRKVTKESNWQDYYGSQKEMKQLVKESQDLTEFDRRILMYCFTKKELTYYETKELFCRGVIEPESSYLNDNISGRFFKRDFER